MDDFLSMPFTDARMLLSKFLPKPAHGRSAHEDLLGTIITASYRCFQHCLNRTNGGVYYIDAKHEYGDEY